MRLTFIGMEEISGFTRHREGTLAEAGIPLAEQSASLELSVSDRVYILAGGQIVHEE